MSRTDSAIAASISSQPPSETPTLQRGGQGLRAGLVYVAYPGTFCILLLLAWQLLVPLLDIRSSVLPLPTAIAAAFVNDFSLIAQHAWPTLYETVVGFLIAAVLGVAIAVTMDAVPLVRKTIYPLLIGSLVVPKVAIAPLFVIWFGFGYTPKVIVVVLIAFFPIVVDMALGLSSFPRELQLLTRSMGASRSRSFWKIKFPYALPNLFVGLKVGMALAIIGSVVAEFVQSSRGLGFLLLQSNSALRTDLFFAVIVALTALGVVLYLAIEALEYVTLRSRRAK